MKKEEILILSMLCTVCWTALKNDPKHLIKKSDLIF